MIVRCVQLWDVTIPIIISGNPMSSIGSVKWPSGWAVSVMLLQLCKRGSLRRLRRESMDLMTMQSVSRTNALEPLEPSSQTVIK